ncbi:ABC transporter permease [Arthrobacter sp. 18067]|uniref:ABC transporter permease n=1 Tax=Arthrobacter sp. 18067 TaxID=2681413 RepID=UPI001356B2C4|nr:ABC transporter permease [Arthrobacter sp. 18067]
MLGFILAGLVLGGIYAISAASIVVTYESAGVLNFAFGALAFFIARTYYFLCVTSGWDPILAAVTAILVIAPILGIFLQFALFRFLTQASQLTKVVATIGIAVTLPAAAELLYGNQAILTSPGLAPRPVPVYQFGEVVVTLDQLLTYGCVLLVLGLGTYVLRRTTVGLLVRATVDSEAMTSLSGISPSRISYGVWAVGTTLAGLAGVLAAPILNVSSVENYTLLTASAFAAVVAARLTSLPRAVAVGLLMGIVGSLLQWLLPTSQGWSANVIASVPFIMVVVFLLYYSIRGRVGDASRGGKLDAAIRVDSTPSVAQQVTARRRTQESKFGRTLRFGVSLIPNNLFVVVALVLPLLLSGYRVGLVGQACAMGVIFLSYTLLTGQGGLISLCQITFAGVGAITTGQVATVLGMPPLLGVVLGAVIAGIAGLIVGALTVRMGNLYVALVTLTFGLMLSAVVFRMDRFTKGGGGVDVPLPGFLSGNTMMAYFMLAIFVAVSLLITAIRSSTSGMAFSAIRDSESGARATGVSVQRMKVAATALAAAIAGLGGGLLAIFNGVALPSSYDAIIGMVWFAVLVTNGAKTGNAALASGLFLVFLPDMFSSLMPVQFGPVPTVLFGLGAILLARNPGGVISLNGQQLQGLGRRILALGNRPEPAVSVRRGA